MPQRLLADYAITPGVFAVDSYSDVNTCRMAIVLIEELLLKEGLVRDLRRGEWRRLFEANRNQYRYRFGKELIKTLIKQNRLIEFASVLLNKPTDDQDWCEEALGTQGELPFSGGVITTESAKNVYPHNSLVEKIDRDASWWTSRSESIRIKRTIEDYKNHLDLVLRYSNSLMFVDPYLDPTKREYLEFYELLIRAGERVSSRKKSLIIEIHRGNHERSELGQDGKVDIKKLENNFRSSLESDLSSAKLKVKVFVWGHFHDRYLISDLMGISLPYGFSTLPPHRFHAKRNPPLRYTLWTRLNRTHRDAVQRDFDPASNRRHDLHSHVGRPHQFTIP